MSANRAQILIRAVDQTKTAFDSIKRGLPVDKATCL